MVCWLFVGSAVFTVLGGQSLGEKWVLSFNLTHIQFMIVLQAIIFIAGCRSRVDRDLMMFVPIFMPLLKHFDINPILRGALVFVNLKAAFLSPRLRCRRSI